VLDYADLAADRKRMLNLKPAAYLGNLISIGSPNLGT
jgi:hypothetical protein